ncbi:MAG: hypothetical protein NTX06_09210 [Proteobacteria bacterium]|jgi:hypothetical protein|nr:hypothetical protein [Pseudomonadota bacterium]
MLQQKGFNRLDFAEAKRVGALVGFDIAACACKKKSCGPGADWLVQDKRYFVLMLLKHIDGLRKDSAAILPDDVQAWYKEAKAAAQEYASMEEALYPVLKKTKSMDK